MIDSPRNTLVSSPLFQDSKYPASCQHPIPVWTNTRHYAILHEYPLLTYLPSSFIHTHTPRASCGTSPQSSIFAFSAISAVCFCIMDITERTSIFFLTCSLLFTYLNAHTSPHSFPQLTLAFFRTNLLYILYPVHRFTVDTFSLLMSGHLLGLVGDSRLTLFLFFQVS